MARCAVIGDPVAHSLSPVIHTAGYTALGLSQWEYAAVRVEAGGVAQFLAGLDESWRGLSVTAPHKREAMEQAEELTERARLAGGVNTLVRTDTGWRGDNTDLPGAVAAVRERFAGTVGSALILGGGATAASTGLAAASLGAEQITLAVRDCARAAPSAAMIAAHPGRPQVHVVDLADPTGLVPADLLISTVPVSAQSAALVSACLPATVVFEVTYNTWPTPLVTAARAQGAVVVSGMDLLIHQAVLQFEQFTGREAPLAAMREAGEAALQAR